MPSSSVRQSKLGDRVDRLRALASRSGAECLRVHEHVGDTARPCSSASAASLGKRIERAAARLERVGMKAAVAVQQRLEVARVREHVRPVQADVRARIERELREHDVRSPASRS